jgi:hypothetical protein
MKKEKNPATIFIEIVGWYGMGAIILAYILVSFEITMPSDPWYQILNLTGSIGVLIISIRKRLFQTVWLNIFWIAIALVAILRILVS